MLCAVVAHETGLRRPQKDGGSRIAELEASAKRGNRDAIVALMPPEFPESLEYLYDAFYAVSLGRGEGMAGAAPLTWQDIDAWLRLTDQQLEPHEVDALLTIDRAFRAALREED